MTNELQRAAEPKPEAPPSPAFVKLARAAVNLIAAVEQPALPPLPNAFTWVGSCMCRGPDGPCADCIARQEAYEEWLDEPVISPREAWAYARTHGAACVAADRAARGVK